MEISNLYHLFLNSNKVITDSRKAEKNALFLALKGNNFDGNKYAKDAIENGCSYAVVDNPKFALDDKYIVVNDVLDTLQSLGQYHRNELNIPIIAITGTNGKTTTKELVASVLCKQYKISYTEGNLNNHIGVPLTLLEMNMETEIGIVEMGANHVGEIKKLCEIAKPNFGIITNIGKAHLEGFGSFNNIIEAKSELYKYIQSHNGKVFYNSNNSILEELIKIHKLDSIDFGGDSSIVRGETLSSDKFLSLMLKLGEFRSKVNTQLIGNYNLENILASASIGFFLGVMPEKIVSAIEQYIPTNNRSQFLKTKYNKLFLDAYNANPTSVEASVKNFMSLNINNKYIILGDMLELGSDSEIEHLKIVKLLQNYNLQNVYLVGEIFFALDDIQGFKKFKNVNNLKDWISKNHILDSNILIKGSRGIKLENIVELL